MGTLNMRLFSAGVCFYCHGGCVWVKLPVGFQVPSELCIFFHKVILAYCYLEECTVILLHVPDLF